MLNQAPGYADPRLTAAAAHALPIPYVRASLGARFVAYLLDVLFILGFTAVLWFAILFLGVVTFGLGWTLFAVLPASGILYSAVTVGGGGPSAGGLTTRSAASGPASNASASARTTTRSRARSSTCSSATISTPRTPRRQTERGRPVRSASIRRFPLGRPRQDLSAAIRSAGEQNVTQARQRPSSGDGTVRGHACPAARKQGMALSGGPPSDLGVTVLR